MLTPAFTLQQNDVALTVVLQCPLIRVQDIEYTLDGDTFYFYAKPYYLRLCLTHELAPAGTEQMSFDVEKGIITLILPKAHPGEYFHDLTLHSVLKMPPKGPLIQEMSDENVEVVYEQKPACSLLLSNSYGFNDAYKGYFSQYPEDQLEELFDIGNPDLVKMEDRCLLKESIEDTSFNEDHYMYDFMDLECNISSILTSERFDVEAIEFSEEENKILSELASIQRSQVELVNLPSLYFSLIDILLAYLYDYRVTQGESTVESPWTIRKLSGTLSCCIVYDSLFEVLVSFTRRSLTWPLYRNWDLSMIVIQDLIKLLQAEECKKWIVRHLLKIHEIFQTDKISHIYNTLYVNDIILWVSKTASQKAFKALTRIILKTEITKSLTKWPLEDYEALTQESD